MSQPRVEILAHYVSDFSFTAILPPYQAKGGTTLSLSVDSSVSELPDPGHHKLELCVSANGRDSEDELQFTASLVVEAIVRLENIPDTRESPAPHLEVLSRLFAMARERLTSLTQFTGYGPVVLPPVDADYLAKTFNNVAPAEAEQE